MCVKQGRNKSSDHFKVYVDQSRLVVWIGNINVSVSVVADDVYPMSDNQTKLQALLDIASKYGRMFKIQYGASNNKITVVGSEIDCRYYEDFKPWTMD